MSSFEIGASRPVGAVQLNTVQPATPGVTAQNPAPTTAATTDTPQVETSLSTSAGTVPVDQTRVAEIRQAVLNGTYPVIPTKISDAMIAAGVLLQKASVMVTATMPDTTGAAGAASGAMHPFELRELLRQMMSVLESERHALAGLDVDSIVGCAVRKNVLCGRLEETTAEAVDEECRSLLDAARRLNETNRRVRNLIAANVSARLDALTGQPALYRANVDAARVRRLR